MSASASYNFTVNRDQLIGDALQYIGALGEGEIPSASAITENSRLFNMLLKLRAADGMPLWMMRRATILPVTEVSSVNTTSHIVISYQTTTISADEASGQTTLSVTSSTDMAASDQIGIEMDDGTMHWTTISSVPDTTSVIITTQIDDAATTGNRVFFYTASADRIPARPVRAVEANILELTNDSSWDITIEARADYYALGSRTSESIPNRIYYSPILGTRAADPTSSTTWFGEFFIYPRFEGGDHVIEFTYQEPHQDVDAASDNLYWPQEFYLPLMLELAALLGPKHGLDLKERTALQQEAKYYRDEALSTIYEEGSVYLQPKDENE